MDSKDPESTRFTYFMPVADARLFVLPSTSPANAAVPWTERLHWFRELAAFVDQVAGPPARALR